jgi:squalene-hopene/tetraprenyl-beta-curcumene cyclase
MTQTTDTRTPSSHVTRSTSARAIENPTGPRTPAGALAAAVAHLRSLQDPSGWWKGELATNVTMDAEDLLLREFLGIRTDQETEEAARWIRSQQRPDGTWATFFGGPPDLSTTVEAWVALRLAGDAPGAPHMATALEFIRAEGGLENTRVFTRIWLALVGQWPWDELPELPPEMVFLPKWFPLNKYDFGCWARQTVVPLTIVGSIKPVRPLPFTVDELRTGRMPAKTAKPWSWDGFFHGLDRVLHFYGRRPIRPLRELAKRRAAEWVLARQEIDGSWGGIQPPWVYSILALHLLGYALEHPALRVGLAGLDGFTIREETSDGWIRRLEACQSPVWDTALALTAMLDAGVAADDQSVLAATDWLLAEEISVKGDWSVRRPDLAPGGWAFEFANDGYPDTDDSAEIVLALRRVAHPDSAKLRATIDRGVAWTAGMQSSDGGWGAFDADNVRTLPNKLPFCDFGEVIDPPSADVTAHVVEMLAHEGKAGETVAQRGIAWLLASQEPDGSWFGRWGANYVYGTGAVVPALVAAGLDPSLEPIRRAVRWLVDHQNPDGGWGEDLRSYDDPATWAGRGESTASQTAWALLALLAAGSADAVSSDAASSDTAGSDTAGSDTARSETGGGDAASAVERGIAFLVDTQRTDGNWDEDFFTGTGFPGDFYINYHLYRLVFPISALGRYLKVAS